MSVSGFADYWGGREGLKRENTEQHCLSRKREDPQCISNCTPLEN